MRILFYATNGLGLGHVTRLLSISREIRKKDSSHEILFLSRCEAGPFPEPEDPFTLRIPSTSRAKTAGLSPKSYYQTTQPLLWQSISSFDPHLLVTDTFPEGSEGELAPIMRWPIRKAFVYRDSRPSAFEKEEMRQKLSPYQMILVAHDHGSIDLPSFLERDVRVRFTGTISEARISESREALRRRLGFTDQKTALVTLGGGGDPEIRSTLPILLQSLRGMAIEFLVATGPLMRSIPEGVSAREWFPAWPLSPWLKAFDLAIGSGGYNTVNELDRAGIPSLLIPFDRDLDDQNKRIREAEIAGWALGVKSREREELEKGIDRLLSSPPRRHSLNPKTSESPVGAVVAANHLLSMITSDRSSLTPQALDSREDSHAIAP